MVLRKPVPPGECRQCWTHAHDPDIHRKQDRSKDCPQCVDHMVNGCPGFERKFSWW